MANAKDLVAKQLARLARASEPEMDFACGGTDTEPQTPAEITNEMIDAFLADLAYLRAATAARMTLDAALFSQLPGGIKTPRSPDLLAITRSIARGS